MPPNVEGEAPEIFGAGKASHFVPFLEDDRAAIELGKFICRGESPRAPSDDNNLII